MATATNTAFARRSYGADGQPITFLSDDRADNQPQGWARGWFEDGAIVNGSVVTHVAEPSWRVSAPIMDISREVEDVLAQRIWAAA